MNRFKIVLTLCLAVAFSSILWAADKKAGAAKEEQSKEAAKMEDLLEKKEYQKAVDLGLKFIESYTKAGKEAELPKGLYIDLGVAYYHLKDYQKALDALDKALERDMFDIQTLEYKATCYHEIKQDDKVVETYKTILQLDPTKKEIKYKLARLLEEQKKNEEAIPVYEELAKEDPAFNNVAYDLAVLLSEKKEYDRALSYLEKAKAASPANEDVAFAMSQTLIKAGKLKEAVPALQDYLKLTKDDNRRVAVMYQLTTCQMKTKAYKEAVVTCDDILKIRPNDEKALLNKAQCYLDSADNASAIPVLEAYLSVSKNEAKKKEVSDLLKSLKGGAKKK